MKSLFLASGSPRRYELLQVLQRPFSVIRPQVEECQAADEAAHQYVRRLAQNKANAGLALLEAPQDAVVIGSDTIVVVDGDVLEKPADEADFMAMFALLSGRTHQVMTAVAVQDDSQCLSDMVTTEIHFCHISPQQAAAYWTTGEPVDKAGGYAIQGYAGKFVEYMKGSYSAVVGLPLFETEQLIQRISGGDTALKPTQTPTMTRADNER